MAWATIVVRDAVGPAEARAVTFITALGQRLGRGVAYHSGDAPDIGLILVEGLLETTEVTRIGRLWDALVLEADAMGDEEAR